MDPPPDENAEQYVPTLSEEYREQVRHWHDRAYNAGRVEGRSEQSFDYLGTKIVVPPEVMPITPMSHLLGDAVLAETVAGERVLDMGTGSGVNAILAASKGANVLAVDINPHALRAALANAERNGVADRMEVRYSDVFSEVEGTFDLVVFDPPFRWFRPRDLLEAAMTDEGYRAMTTFFHQARQHLASGGRMLIFFGTSGDLGYLHQLVADCGFVSEVVAQDELTRDGWRVEYFTFRLT
ncbi:MAG TPA: methyltransferase [Acidimicrobiales bacterium]|nr:methyltransferase [Acidimicrobiales bacterium]